MGPEHFALICGAGALIIGLLLMCLDSYRNGAALAFAGLIIIGAPIILDTVGGA